VSRLYSKKLAMMRSRKHGASPLILALPGTVTVCLVSGHSVLDSKVSGEEAYNAPERLIILARILPVTSE
jgi:hypothetical protein